MQLDHLPELFGPGNAQELRSILARSAEICTTKGCEHCAILDKLLSEIDAPRLHAAGPGHCVCAVHGLQMAGHTCHWGVVHEW